MNKTQAYINTNKDRFLNELMELLRIPSVSADSSFNNDVQKCAEALSTNLESIGLSNVHVYPTAGHPIVYGERIIDDALPTVLVYGHYDVQPADPLDLWHSDPFDPIVKKNRIASTRRYFCQRIL